MLTLTIETRLPVSFNCCQFPRAFLMASETGFVLPGGLDVFAAGSGGLPSARRTQSYCSQPRSGNSRSTAFHFGQPRCKQ